MGRTHRRTGRQRGKRAWGQEGMEAGGMTKSGWDRRQGHRAPPYSVAIQPSQWEHSHNIHCQIHRSQPRLIHDHTGG